LSIVVPVIRETVGLYHGPVGQVGEEQVGRIHDVVLLLCARSTAQRNISTTGDGVPSDVLLCLQQEDRSSRLPCLNGGGQANGPGPDHHDIRLSIPLHASTRGSSFRN